ncbi:CD282 [Mytilus edulis]|uniref:TLR2 n=1 Tax=Mytilus edulis TaxID=6550 RepID=A0A8S3VAK1_MYTED|nr:CD282 [Mytilus edulis]
MESILMEFQDLNTKLEIHPGLIRLNLNIMNALDMHVIQEAKQNIEKLLIKEHPIVENVQKNIIAILKTKIPRERREARFDLENIRMKSPDNLNVLADLECIYTELDRSKEAEVCKQKYQQILSGTSKNNIRCKQICLLEQGYAILIERTLINQSTVELRITDLHKILSTELERSQGRRKECFERGLHHQIQVLRNVRIANEDEIADRHLVRKGSSLQKFKLAESLDASFPNKIWNYYYAKALNQYYDSLETVLKRTDHGKDTINKRQIFEDDLTKEMKKVTLKAIENFWMISQIQINNPIVRTFVARSYAYIGHILMKRGDMVHSSGNSFNLNTNKSFKRYTNNPVEAAEMAYRLKKNDMTVLTRYGRTLWNKSKSFDDIKEKLVLLHMANDILTCSIDVENTGNWFAFSTRMHVRKQISDIRAKRDIELARKYLLDALQDGEAIFKSQNTQKDLTILAEICQKLAKFPHTHKYGHNFVHTEGLLHQALDYLLYASYLGDRPDFHFANRKASCLFDLGEYAHAIEWGNKAWLLSSPSTQMSFYILCIYMVTMFEDDLQMPFDQLVKEFLYALIYGKRKYNDIQRSIENIYKKNQKGLLKLIKAIIVEPKTTLRTTEKDILSECINIWTTIADTGDLEEYSKLEAILKDMIPRQENEYVLSETFHQTSLKPLGEGRKACSREFEYDFFISHSHKDEDWVTNILLRHLESQFDEQDVAFKGCIADRDFIPGTSILDNIIGAIKKSNKVILILTDHFVSSNWCQYEADRAVIKSLNLDSKDINCVIPIVLEECTIPEKIDHLNFIDMTIKRDFVQEMMRLKKVLLPEDK